MHKYYIDAYDTDHNKTERTLLYRNITFLITASPP